MAHTYAPPVDRVKWFRSRADRDRWQEEIEKLEVEFTCTILFHTKMAAIWRELANKVEGNKPADRTAAVYNHSKGTSEHKPGARCYDLPLTWMTTVCLCSSSISWIILIFLEQIISNLHLNPSRS